MSKSNRAILAGLFLSLVFNSSTGLTAPTCVDIFKKIRLDNLESQITSIAEQYVENWKSYKDNKIDYETYKANEQKLNEEFQGLLEKAGLKVRYEAYNWTGFEILPEGTHPLAKLAARLIREGITLMVSPSIWTKDALGSFDSDRRVLNVDLQTIITGRVSFVTLHELRHAHGGLRSFKDDGAYERVFQTDLDGESTPGRQLPEMSGMYKDHFALDEILAHRQSATFVIRELKRNPKDESAIFELKNHGERLKLFVDSGIATLRSLKREVEVYDYNVFELPDRPMAKVYVEVAESGLLSTWFREDSQDKNLVGLTVKFMIPMEELPQKVNVKSMQPLLLSKIDATIAELEALRPAVEKVFNATESLKRGTGKELKKVEEALHLLTETIAQRRKALQAAQRTLH